MQHELNEPEGLRALSDQFHNRRHDAVWLITQKNRLQMLLQSAREARRSPESIARIQAEHEELVRKVDELKAEILSTETAGQLKRQAAYFVGIPPESLSTALQILRDRDAVVKTTNQEIDCEIADEVERLFAERRREAVVNATKPFDDALDALRSSS